MLENFRFFAFAYLDDWWQYDSLFVKFLSLDQNREVRLHWLGEAANYYQVSRRFKGIETKGWGKALDALDEMGNGITQENVDSTVSTLAKKLKSAYDTSGEELSAASKFLWIRHQSPALVYDSRACTCLTALGEKMAGDYTGYRNAWLGRFDKREESIRLASAELVPLKDFAPDEETAQCLGSIVATRWFHERVFDKFLWWNGKGNGSASRSSAARRRRNTKEMKSRAQELGILDAINEEAEGIAQASHEEWKAKQANRTAESKARRENEPR